MRLAILVDGLYPDKLGGIQKYTTALASQLAKEGLEVVLYVQHASPNATLNLKSLGVQIQTVPVGQLRIPILGYLWANREFSKKALLQAELEGAQLIYAQGMAGVAAAYTPLNIEVLHNFHGLEMFQPVKGWKARIIAALFRKELRKLLRKAPKVISLGAKISEIILGENKNSEVTNIPNGIASEWMLKDKRNYREKGKKFLLVGRHEWRKGLDTFEKAWTELRSKPSFDGMVAFVGGIPEHLRLQDDRAVYLGELRDEEALRKIYMDADVLLCPSYSEGMPTVVLEAMACGLPVIATNVGATGELVDAEIGALIPPFDSHALAQAMEQMATKNTQEMEQMGAAALQRVQTRFNWEQVADKHIVVFKQICA